MKTNIQKFLIVNSSAKNANFVTWQEERTLVKKRKDVI
jgi:hypothetical protein